MNIFISVMIGFFSFIAFFGLIVAMAANARINAQEKILVMLSRGMSEQADLLIDLSNHLKKNKDVKIYREDSIN